MWLYLDPHIPVQVGAKTQLDTHGHGLYFPQPYGAKRNGTIFQVCLLEDSDIWEVSAHITQLDLGSPLIHVPLKYQRDA